MLNKRQYKNKLQQSTVRLNSPKLKPEVVSKLLALLDKYDSLDEVDNQNNLNWLILYNSKFRSQVLNIIKIKKS